MTKYIKDNSRKYTVDRKVTKNTKACILQASILFFLFILRKFITNLPLLDKHIKNVQIKDLRNRQETINREEETLSRIFTFSKTKNRILYFVSFVYILISVELINKKADHIVSVLSAVFVFWFYLKFSLWLFKKIEVFKCLIFWIIIIVYNYQTETFDIERKDF